MSQKPRKFLVGPHYSFRSKRDELKIIARDGERKFETDDAEYIHVSRGEQLRGYRLGPNDSIEFIRGYRDLPGLDDITEQVGILRDLQSNDNG